MKIQKATLRLFKSLPVGSKRKKSPTEDLLNKTLPKGFAFSPEIVANYSDYDSLIKLVEDEYGLTAEQLNASFHKSWDKVKNASIEQLVLEQIMHYFTTYGFESLGIYNESSVFIPKEDLEIPELKEGFKFVIIKGYTNEELKQKVIDLLSTGIALKEDTMKDIMTIINYVGFSAAEIEKISNREIKIQLYDRLGIVPENPTEFLRYLIFKNTGETLLIKNKNLINKIGEGPDSNMELLREYSKKHGLERLSEIFYRFKPLFLSFRKYECYKKDINKIRKLAKKNHKPMNLDYLNEITGLIKNSNKIDNKTLKEELSKVNTFRKIRLAYALKFRTTESKSIMYRVRNGKSYSTEFEFNNKEEAKRVLKIVLDSISEGVEKNVKGKKVYMPENINYTLPATEKQFIGNLPNGSYVECPENMLVGINWFNTDRRIDLDLKMSSITGQIGWDEDYRTEGREVMFSGDITDATGENGATELFKFSKQPKNPYIMTVNYYNYEDKSPVDFKILVADEKPSRFKSNYMVDPNNLIVTCKSKIDVKQMVLGLVIPTTNGSRFYFTETGLGNSITAKDTEYLEQAREFLVNQYNHSIELKDILKKAGAVFIDKKEDAEVNLDYEDLEKDTILDLLK